MALSPPCALLQRAHLGGVLPLAHGAGLEAALPVGHAGVLHLDVDAALARPVCATSDRRAGMSHDETSTHATCSQTHLSGARTEKERGRARAPGEGRCARNHRLFEDFPRIGDEVCSWYVSPDFHRGPGFLSGETVIFFIPIHCQLLYGCSQIIFASCTNTPFLSRFLAPFQALGLGTIAPLCVIKTRGVRVRKCARVCLVVVWPSQRIG